MNEIILAGGAGSDPMILFAFLCFCGFWRRGTSRRHASVDMAQAPFESSSRCKRIRAQHRVADSEPDSPLVKDARGHLTLLRALFFPLDEVHRRRRHELSH